ncbi:nucleotide exchange factor GrpE [Streptomyces sp. NBC_01304]|uniref:nucleotide exchange factor GrpE n=1 Tax=Streptomyces sp. NBC_01304 TaxID=2903818 RepID=UPI002E0D465A|nr:nucleotide exchange factor GrpE [Streptomyces sp. NBC_01304]
MNGSAAAGPPSELDKLRRRVEALSRKRDEAEARLHRLLSGLLPLDDLLADTRSRAGALHDLRSARETSAIAVALGEQIEAAHLMLRGEFARHDVRPMEVVGRAADPAEMRVIATEPHPSLLEGTVLRETSTGFRLGSSTLRPAEVVIAEPGPVVVAEPDSAVSTEPGPARWPEAAVVSAAGSEPSAAGPPPGTRGRRAQPRRTTRSQRRTSQNSAPWRGRRRRRS